MACNSGYDALINGAKTMWLIQKDILSDMRAAKLRGHEFTADQQASFSAALRGDASEILSIAGNTAQIDIEGVLTNRPDIFAYYFGGGNTTYPDILAAINSAITNPEVTKIILSIDSGGGHVTGMFDVMDAIRASTKPIEAIGRNTVASAAYGIASQAGKLYAANRATQWGSIGVAASFYVDENEVDITSTNAPDKRPDVSTDEGKAVVRAQLDQWENIFIESIASARGVTTDKVISDFGKGGVMLTSEAVKRGMIDGIAGATPTITASAETLTASSGGTKPEAKPMDLNKLQAEHPEVFTAAVNVGVQQERDRVEAHLEMGDASGDMKTAVEAVKGGDQLTSKLIARYQGAVMRSTQTTARADDEDDLNAGASNPAATTAEQEDAASKAILAKAAEGLGATLTAEA